MHGEAGKGAFELDGQMIDAPVYKQVRSSCRLRAQLIKAGDSSPRGG